MPYDVDRDPYTDGQTGVMRNLLGKTAAESLEAAEANIASSEIAIILQQAHPLPSDLTYTFFLGLHRQIFGAVYEWAGKLRTVEVSKGTTSFARVDYLGANLQTLLRQLADDDYCAADSLDEFVAQLAHYYSELNVLHPFREGNGRTIRTFLSLLADCHGCYIAWDQMDPTENIQACIASYNGDEAPLCVVLRRLVTPW